MSCVTCYLSHVTCHLTTTLCSFSCYESPTIFGNAAVARLVIKRVKINKNAKKKTLNKFNQLLFGPRRGTLFNYKSPALTNKNIHQGDRSTTTRKLTSRLNWSGGLFSEIFEIPKLLQGLIYRLIL